ncbi:MAG: methylmalonyl-CoA epimerase [Pseudomonadota bacterium]|jgi:methylmalonyl-CoA epimerase
MSTPTTWTVDHIGIAVSDIEAAISLYASTAGTSVTLREKLVDRGVELAFLNTGGTKIELLMPLQNDTPIARFLAKRGPGLHHICYKVDNIRKEMDRLGQLGAKLIDSTPRPGATGTIIAFLEPDSFSGVLTELCEYTGS